MRPRQRFFKRDWAWIRTAACRLWRMGLTAAFFVTLQGCADLREVDDLNIVLGLGVDRVGDQVLVTAEIVHVTPQESSRQSGQPREYILRQQTGRTMEDAILKLESMVPRHLFLSANMVVAFGEDYAKNGLDGVIDYLERDRHYRGDQLLVLARGSAEKVFTADPAPVPYHALAIRKLVEQSTEVNRSMDSRQFALVRHWLDPPRMWAMACVEVGPKQTLRNAGVGLMKNGRWVGSLNPEQTQWFSILRGESRRMYVTLPWPGGAQADAGMTYQLVNTESSVVAQKSQTGMRFVVRVRGQAELERICPDERLDPTRTHQLEVIMDRHLAGKLRQTVDQLKTFNVDAGGFGTLVYRHWPGEWKQLKPGWQSEGFRRSVVNYDVQLQIIRSGMSNQAPSRGRSGTGETSSQRMEERTP